MSPDHEPQPDDGFIPDLCRVRAVFLLVLITELVVVLFALARSSSGLLDWHYLGLASLLAQWVTLTAAGLICWLRGLLKGLGIPLASTAITMLVLVDTAAFTLLGQWLLNPATPLLNVSLTLMRNLLMAGLITLMLLRYFHLQYQRRRQEEAELEARVAALQARIRPHFLFNSMNTIASLTRTRPALAEQAVENLADLFRATLGDGGKRVALTEELELVQRYLDIERLRLGERLHTEWAVDESLTGALVPLLIVQPLVENAVYHGVEPLAEGGTIRIEVGGGDGALMIAVTNPLPTSDSRRHREGNRMALANIRERLAYAYGRAAELGVSEAEGHYRVEIRLPFDGDARSDRR